MNFADYQAAAARTMQPTTGIRTEDRHARLILALGLVGEAGEVADLIKKVEGHGHELDLAKLDEELGDLLWYVAATAEAYGRSLNVIAAGNERKLRARYPKGFSEKASRERAEIALPAPGSFSVSYCETCKPLNHCCNCVGGRECGTKDCPPCATTGKRQAVTQ